MAAPSARVAAIALTVQSVVIVLQPVWIGSYLNGHPEALTLHLINADGLDGLAVLVLAAVAVAGIRRTLPRRLLLGQAIVLVALVIQTVLGYTLQLAVHVPLGVVLVGGSWALTGAAWRAVRAARAAATAATEKPVVEPVA